MGLGGPKWMDFGDILAIHVDLKAIFDAVGSAFGVNSMLPN